jgi:predicted aspartyl protease
VETDTMGRVLVTAKVENYGDLEMAVRGLLPADQVRSVEVQNALVDTGASTLSMPKSMIERLGLRQVRTRTAVTSAGVVTLGVFGPAKLTIQGRDCPIDVAELPEECPVLIGQLPLEAMDWVIDMKNHCIIGNPAHGGEQVIELYWRRFID